MNPLYQQFFGAVLRWALTAVSAWLVQKGILVPDQAASLVVGTTSALLVLGWSLYEKYVAQRLLNTAAALGPMPVQASKDLIAGGVQADASTPAHEQPVLKGGGA